MATKFRHNASNIIILNNNALYIDILIYKFVSIAEIEIIEGVVNHTSLTH